MYKWRTGRSCVFKNNVHLVFVIKYRRGVFTSEMLEFGGEDDHIHIMVSVHPKLAISNLVSKLKGKSSYLLGRGHWCRIRTMLWGKHFWTPSYCVVSCGGASLDVVKQYIEQQRTPLSEQAVKTSKKLSKISQTDAKNKAIKRKKLCAKTWIFWTLTQRMIGVIFKVFLLALLSPQAY